MSVTSPWQGRLEALAARITEPCRVLDVGAGTGALEALLPKGSVYVALDNVWPVKIPCWCVDLEIATEIPGPHNDVAVLAGVLEHVTDPVRVLRMVATVSDRLLLSYVTTDTRATGRDGWKSHLSEDELLGALPGMVRFGTWDEHGLYEVCP